MKISVALAAYKGEKYIKAQLESILPQLAPDSQVVVSDDLPDGKIRDIIASLGDSRVEYVEGASKGVCANFENALRRCTGDVIFLCDQDDCWLPEKVAEVMKAIENGADLVLHDAFVTDADLNVTEPSYFAVHSSNASFVSNIVRNCFVGCCMAFRRELLDFCLPFPADVPMHDWWIALAAMKKHKKVVLLNKSLIYWRRHGETVTGRKNSFAKMLEWRIKIISELIKL